MRGPQRLRAAYLVTMALAGLGTLVYLVRIPWLPAGRVEGEAVTLGATFVALAAVGVLRAIRSGGRTGDVLMALGLVSSSLGWLYWSVLLVPLERPPYPSPADVLWMALFPLAYASLAWQAGSGGAARRALVLDILIGSAGVTAAVAGLVVPALAGDLEDLTTVGVNSVYLGANVAHVLLLVGVVAMRGFRVPGALWRRLAAAAILAVTNASWLVDLTDTGIVPLGTVLNLGWLGAFALMVSSVGVPAPDPAEGRRWSGAVVVVPLSGTVLSLAVLLVAGGRFQGARWIAAAAVVLAMVRMAQAVADAYALAGSHRLARTDELTGLVNRRGFYDELRRVLAERRSATLVLADVNRFKEVNDTLGHQVGDALLVQVATRLAESSRGSGRDAEGRWPPRAADIAARFGGDEFTLVLHQSGPVEGEAAARRLLAALDDRYDVGGMSVHCSLAAGLVHLPGDGAEIDELIRRADVAMYAAKAGSEAVVTYRPELDTRTIAELARTERVRAGLEEGRLVLHYQPKVDLTTGAVVGVEALARLRDVDGTVLAPAQFLPALDRSGELTALTAQVLDQAVAQAAVWRAAGAPLPVAINVPAPALVERFGDQVRDALRRHDLPGELLYVEVTEESLLHDRQAGRAAIEAVRALGVRVAVDDYGTGWSSLTYLRELPLDELKLDRSFISGMAGDERVTRIVRSTVALAHGLDLVVVAEGVETAEDRVAATASGCDLAQGYLFAHPVPAEDLSALLAVWPEVVTPVDRTA
jgi:diguanylate cyclase (GGDEF)-like protein